MGLLDKWSKKQEKEQLEAVEKNTADVTVDTKSKIKKTKKSATEKKSTTATAKGLAYRVLIRPLVSEKATGLEMQGKYVFVVDKDATKEDIKKAIHELYGVTPIGVRTMQFEGKRVRFGYVRGKRSDWKKAVVELPKGHTIHIHEGV